METENYRSCIHDCMAALEISPTNIKAYYRMASAFSALNKFEEASAACTAGLSVNAKNAALLRLQQQITRKTEARDAAHKKKEEEEARRKTEAATLAQALKLRKIRTRDAGERPELEDAAVKLVPDPLSLSSTLVFPVLLLYPLHGQSDLIKAFGEEQTLAGHMDYLLPLPWDAAGEYTPAAVDAYVDTAAGGLSKWGKQVELLTLLSGAKVEVVDGLVRVYLVPKARAPAWIAQMKERKGRA